MVDFTIVVEGGGQSPSLKKDMAEGFRNLFNKISPTGKKPRLIRGGGRNQALDKFVTAWKLRKQGDMVFLLIDSEEPLKFSKSKIDHLVSRDSWTERPRDISEDDVFLMVCTMEAWICADHNALKNYYGGGFVEDALPSLQSLESTSREKLFEALTKATASCKKKRPYHKGQHSFELIGLVSPKALEALPHAKQFMEALKNSQTGSG